MGLVFIAWVAYALFVYGVIQQKIVLADRFSSDLIIGILAFALVIWSANRLSNPKPRPGSAAQQQAPARSATPQREHTDTLKELTFHVAGVTFDNEDGTNRQKILRALRFGDEPYAAPSGLNDVQIIDTFYDGELAYEVHVNDYQIGYVPKKLIPQVKAAMDTCTCTADQIEFIGGGTDEDGNRRSYGAIVTLTYYG